MPTPGRRLACLGAVLALGVAAAGASANRLSVGSTSFDVTWRPVTFGLIAEGVYELFITCDLTLSGSFNQATLRKTAGTAIASITGFRLTECEGDEAESAVDPSLLAFTLPWSVVYTSFTGTLPNVRSVALRLVGMAIRLLNEPDMDCLAQTTETSPAQLPLTLSAGTVTAVGLAADPSLRGGDIFCLASSFTVEGTGVMNEGRMTIQLI